jgi:hypothetical protein
MSCRRRCVVPLNQQLLAQIYTTLGQLISTNVSSNTAGSDLYEAYIWALVVEASRREGARVRFLDRQGDVPTSFYFRGSPSSIYSTAHDYCHAEIEFDDCPALEAHVGIYVSGKSQVQHECDVAVLYKDEADICRNRQVDPRSSKLILAAECKCYINATLGIGLGRSFLGLINDIYAGDRFFVSTKDSSSVRKLFSKHNREYELGISPLNVDLETRLRGTFEKTFRDFRSGHS